MISSETEAEIERLWRAEGIHRAGTIARMLHLHRDVAVRVLSTAGLLPVDGKQLSVAARRASILDPYLPLIEETLRKYPDVCASRVFAIIRARGYTGASTSHVRAAVRARRPMITHEAFLKLSMLPGEQAQVDWGHFGDAGEAYPRRKLYAFAMTLSYSRKIFLRFFLSMRLREFQQGFCEGFEYFGGVPRKILIDNLKSGVSERVAHLVRFNEDFLALARHYAFEPCAANIRRGNEKGRVERAIRYIRDNFFAARSFVSLEDLNSQALNWCETSSAERKWPQERSITVAQAFAREAPKLLALPPSPLSCLERHLVKVSKQAYVFFDGNEYSVPPPHVGRQVEIVASEHEMKIFGGTPAALLSAHRRTYSRAQVIRAADHDEAVLASKPGARRHAGLNRLISMIPDAEEFVSKLAERGENLGGAVSSLLMRIETHGVAPVACALREVLASGSCTLRAVNFVLCRLEREQTGPLEEPALVATRFGELVVTPHNAQTYDEALGVGHEDP